MMRSSVKYFLIVLILYLFTGCAGSDQILVSDRYSEPGEAITELYLFADERDLNRLYSRNPRSDTRIEGYVRIGETGRIRTLRNGFRFRGNTTRYHPKKSFNIRFEHPQPFLFNSPRMNLNAMYTDPSGMREKLTWDMFYELGRPASKSRYFTLHINNSYEGLGIHVQRVDEVLLQHNGLDPSGSMLRDLTRRRGAGLGVDRQSIFGYNLADEQDKPAFLSSLFNTRWNPDWQEVADLVQWVHDTPPGREFEDGFRQRVDTEVFIDWLAIHYMIGDVDAFGDDYWIYRGRGSSDKWKIIPWDHDISFGKNERDGLTENRGLGQYGNGLVQLNDYFAYEYPIDDAGWDNKLISSFLETPGLILQLKDRMSYLMNEKFTQQYFRERTEIHRIVIEPYITKELAEGRFKYNERQHHGLTGKFDYHVENILDFVELRYAFLDRQINPVEGEAYYASAGLSSDGHTPVLLTDATGWTIAKFEPQDVTGNPVLTIQSSESEVSHENKVNREWSVQIEDGNASGRLTLYYRNDIAPDGKENWYYIDDAIGDQWELRVFIDGEESGNGYVNPYSNKVSGDVSITGLHVLYIN